MELKRDQAEITKKIQKQMNQDRIDVLLLTKGESILYATGFASKFAYMMQKPGVSMAVIPANGDITLIINDFEEGTANIQAPGIKVCKYSTWMYIHDENAIPELKNSSQLNLDQSFDLTVQTIRSYGNNLCVGVELDYLTWNYRDRLLTALPQMKFVNGIPSLMRARKIKTKWEIAIMRKATWLAEQTMKETAKKFQPGMTSFDLLNIYSRTAFELDNHVIDVFLAQGLGSHYSAVWVPNNIPCVSGDIVMLDGGVNYYGYHSDIARTFCLQGKPTSIQSKIFNALRAGFDAGRELLKPGVPFSEVFQKTQKAVQAHGLPYYTRGHVGHSVGVGNSGFVEESPFIGPDEPTVIEPGMVLSFECPCYGRDGAFNIEDSFVITERGCEPLSNANTSLTWPED